MDSSSGEIGTERDKERQNAQLLAMLDSDKIKLPGVDYSKLFEFTKQQIKENFVKPKRISGREDDPKGEKYVAPIGIFNLGNNSLFYKTDVKKEDEEKKEDGKKVLKDVKLVQTVVDEETGEVYELEQDVNDDDEKEDIEIHNNVKMVDGKLFYVEDEQGETDAEEERYHFNIAVKNDLPYQIYRNILFHGRLTMDEIYERYKAVQKEMIQIIIHDMVNKRFLKFYKDIEQDVEFDEKATNIKDYVKIKEKEIETLEVVTEQERRKILEDKKYV